MNRLPCRPLAIVVTLVALVVAASAQAGLFRAYLSSNGSDSNPCTAQLPCRLMPAALAAVNDGGEIWLVDSANFNTSTVNITKSVSIVGVPGALASFVANGSDAIFVNAPGLTVTVRNLNLRQFAGTPNGINVANVGKLSLENVVVENMGTGLHLNGPAVIDIDRSVFRFNGTDIFIFQTGVEVVSIHDTRFLQSSNQAIAGWTNSTTGSLKITVDGSVISGAGCCNGALAFGGAIASAAPLSATIMRSKITGNGSGLGVGSFGAGTVVTIGECHISDWGTAGETLNGASGVGHLETLGNNMIAHNGSGLFGAVAVSPQ